MKSQLPGPLPPDDRWHVIGVTGEPAFVGAWVNLGGSYATAAFRRMANGAVLLRGTVKSGAGSGGVIFTLPAGYRPGVLTLLGTLEKPSGAATTCSELDVTAAGDLKWFGSAAPTFVQLDGLTFFAEG